MEMPGCIKSRARTSRHSCAWAVVVEQAGRGEGGGLVGEYTGSLVGEELARSRSPRGTSGQARRLRHKLGQRVQSNGRPLMLPITIHHLFPGRWCPLILGICMQRGHAKRWRVMARPHPPATLPPGRTTLAARSLVSVHADFPRLSPSEDVAVRLPRSSPLPRPSPLPHRSPRTVRGSSLPARALAPWDAHTHSLTRSPFGSLERKDVPARLRRAAA